MTKRKFTTILAALLLMASVMAACSGSAPASGGSRAEEENAASASSGEEDASLPTAEVGERPQVRVGVLKGPSGMGMAGLMDANDQALTDNQYIFELAGAPEDITAKLLSGEVDIAALPTNVASVLYNKTEGGLRLICINTLGMLYVLDSGGEINAISDLKGKTLYATGQGAAPEYVTEYLLKENGLTPGVDVVIEYKAEHAELAALMASGDVTLGLLPQPFVTTVTSKNAQVKTALDLTAEWAALTPDIPLAMTCLVARSEFLTNNKDAADAFLLDFEESVRFVNRDIGDAAELIGKYGIVPKEVAEIAIPGCNIVFLTGEEMQQGATGFLRVLFEANPQAVGGKVPGDDFYYHG